MSSNGYRRPPQILLGTGPKRWVCGVGEVMPSFVLNFRANKFFMSILGALLLLTILLGCSASRTPTPVQTPTPAPVTVRLLIDEMGMFAGQKVTLTGTVVLECTTGCWFFLDDGTGKIYIDLSTADLHIPQKVGSRVTLLGSVIGSGGNLHIQAEQVEFPE